MEAPPCVCPPAGAGVTKSTEGRRRRKHLHEENDDKDITQGFDGQKTVTGNHMKAWILFMSRGCLEERRRLVTAFDWSV